MAVAPFYVVILVIVAAFFCCYKITTKFLGIEIRKKLVKERYSITMQFRKSDETWGFVIIDNETGENAGSVSAGSKWHTFFVTKEEAEQRCKMYNQYGVK